jgi:uncharacterized membrane protein YidH (DUF202 family)
VSTEVIGAALIVLGMGNAALGWAFTRSLTPRIRAKVAQLEASDHRRGRWSRTAHQLDRLQLRLYDAVMPVLLAVGLIVACAGCAVVAIGLLA